MIFLQEKMDPVPQLKDFWSSLAYIKIWAGDAKSLGQRCTSPVGSLLHPALGSALRHSQVAASFFLSTRGQSMGSLLIIW